MAKIEILFIAKKKITSIPWPDVGIKGCRNEGFIIEGAFPSFPWQKVGIKGSFQKEGSIPFCDSNAGII